MCSQLLAHNHVQADEAKDGRLANGAVLAVPGEEQGAHDLGQHARAHVVAHVVDALLHHADGDEILRILGRLDHGPQNASARVRRQAASGRVAHVLDELVELAGRRLAVLVHQLLDGQLDIVRELGILELYELAQSEQRLRGDRLVELIFLVVAGPRVQVVEQEVKHALEVLVHAGRVAVAGLDELGEVLESDEDARRRRRGRRRRGRGEYLIERESGRRRAARVRAVAGRRSGRRRGGHGAVRVRVQVAAGHTLHAAVLAKRVLLLLLLLVSDCRRAGAGGHRGRHDGRG